MKPNSLNITGVVLLLTGAVEASVVRFDNPHWDEPIPRAADLAFNRQLITASGGTDWLQPGYVEGVEDYVDVEDASCNCPDGYTPPCYMVALPGSAGWDPW